MSPTHRLRISRIVVAVLLLVLLAPARAQLLPTTWSGTGNWTDTARWSLGLVPAATNSAQIASGTVTLADARSVGAIAFSGGALIGTGTLTLVSTGSTWTGGTMNSAGGLVIQSGADLTLGGTSAKDFNTRTITNQGTVNWQGGDLRSGNGGAIMNQGNFNDSTAGVLGAQDLNNDYGGTWTFTNAATGNYTKSGSGTTRVYSIFNNSGAVSVQAGTLDLNGGGTHAGSVAIAAGATFGLDGGTHTFAAESLINGSGTLRISAGTANFNGTIGGGPNIILSSGTAAFNGTTTTTGGGTYSSGTLSGTGTLTHGAAITLSGTTLTGAGMLNADGGATISGTFSINNSRTLNLGGNSTWSSGYLYAGGSSVITVKPGATFTAITNNTINGTYYGGGAATTVFNNQGTLTKSTSTGTTDITALFNNTGTVNVQAGTLDLGGGGTHSGTADISAGATLALTSGTHTFTSGAVVNGAGNLRVAGGTTTFNGATTGSANILVAGGTAAFNGTTSTTGSGTLSGGTLNGTGTLSFGGLLTLSGTTLSGAILNADGGAAITNNFSFNSGQTLNLTGASTWSAGYIYGGGSSVLNNKVGATLTNSFNGTLNGNYWGGGAATTVFNNHGTFTKTTATGTTNITAVFNNPGTVNVDAGTLSLDAGGSSSGTITLTPGSTLDLGGGNFAFTTGALINGAGTIRVAGGTTTFSGANTGSANLAVAGGTATFNGTTSTTGGGTLSGGTLNGTGTLTLGGLLTLSGTTLSGAILNADGGAAITNNFSINSGQTLNLTGTNTWSAGYIYGGGSSVLNNKAGATLTTNFNGTLNGTYYGGGAATTVFNNLGTFTKSTGTGTTDIGAVFNNASTGVINVQTGTLALGGGGTNSGTVNVASGATLTLDGGSHAFTTGALINGAGTIRVAGGTTTFSGANTGSANLAVAGGTATFNGTTSTTGGGTLSGGTLNGTGTLTLGDLLTLSGTTLSGTILNADGGAAITNNFSINSGQTLNLTGTNTWSAGYIYGGGSSVLNNKAGATLTTNFNGTLNGTYYGGGAATTVFNNLGTFTKSTGTGTTDIGAVFNNASTGVINVQTGTLALGGGGTNSGTVNVASGATLALDGGSHAFTTGALIDGAGTVRVAGGTTTFSGANTGSANIAVTAGVATFNGTTSTTGGGTLSGGTLNGTGTLTFGGLLTLSGTTLSGAILNADGGAAITSNFSINSGQTLNLTGANTWSAGYIYGGGSSILNNKAGATFTTSFNGTLNGTYYGGGAATTVFNNLGTFTKSAGTGTTDIGAVFNNSGTVNVQTGSVSLHSGGTATAASTFAVSSGAALNFAGGTFTLASGASLGGAGAVNLSSGTLAVASGTATVASLAVSGGTLGGSTGGVAITTLSHSGGSIAIGTLALSGTSTWTGGDWNGSAGATATIASGGTLTLSNGGYHDFNRRAIVNSGTVNWNSGYIRSGNGGSFTNAAGATFNDLQPSGYTIHNPNFEGTTGTFVFTNNGTYVRNAANTSYVDVPFHNNGTVSVVQGDLRFRAGGTLASTGTISATAGTNVYFDSGYVVGNGASLTGAGGYWLTGGTLDVTGTINVGTLNQTGGMLAGTNVLNGLINWNGGNWNAAAPGPSTTIASTATLNLGNGGYRDFHQRAIVNNGIVNWNSGYIRSGSGGSFTNAAGATFHDLQTSGYTIHNYSFGGAAGPFVFTNNGTYIRNATNTSYVDVPFHNHGTVSVVTGDLQFRSGGTLAASGTISAASGTNVLFTEGFVVANGASLTGAGGYWLTGGTLDVPGTINVSTLNQTGGVLAGTNVLNGVINWTGGNWNTAAVGPTTTIASTATLNLGSGGYRDFHQRAIVNQGIVNWNSGYIRSGSGGSFTNATGATFNDLQSSGYTIHNYSFGAAAGTFAFTNDGTYVRNGANTSYVDIPFNNNGTVSVLQGDLQFRNGGTLAATGSISAAAGTNVVFTSGYTVSNGSSLTGAGAYWLTGGTLTLTGQLNVGTFNQSGGSLAGTGTINGLFNWTGGDWNGAATTTIASGASLNMGNGGYHDFNRRTVVNNGTVNWSSGYIRSGGGGSFTNTGTFNDVQASGYSIHNPSFESPAGTFVFSNTGTYVRNAGNTTYFETTFDNSGTLTLSQGDLQLRAGGTMAATSVTNAAAGTHLYFTNNYTLADGATFTGLGLFTQTGGTLTVNGTLRASNFNWHGGNWNAATAGLTTTVGATTILNLGNGGYHDFDRRAVVNNGIVNWSSGYIRSGNNGSFTNAAGATFNDLQTSGYTVHNYNFGGTSDTFAFINNGTYVRNVGGTTYFDTTFNNNGTINLSGGDIQLREGGTMSATSVVNAAAGTHLYFTNNYTLTDGATFAGPGGFTQTGGTLTLNGTLQAPSFNWHGGNWNAATAGLTTSVGSTTVLNLGNGGYHDFDRRAVVNHGIVNWTSGYLRSGNGGSFTNAAGGVFNDQNTSGYTVHNPFGGTFTFTNDGTYRKATTGTTVFSVPFTNNGTLAVTAGAVVFNSTFTNNGALALGGGATIQSSGAISLGTAALTGTGTINAASVTAGGLVSPGNSAGTLTLTGNLTLLATSTLLFELGGGTPGSGYDVLLVGGSATLAGNLSLQFLNGYQFSVTPGATFTLLTASGTGGLTGSFANIANGQNLLTSDGAALFRVNYGIGSAFAANSIVLSNFVAVPEPSTYVMLGLGAAIILWQVRRRRP